MLEAFLYLKGAYKKAGERAFTRACSEDGAKSPNRKKADLD